MAVGVAGRVEVTTAASEVSAVDGRKEALNGRIDRNERSGPRDRSGWRDLSAPRGVERFGTIGLIQAEVVVDATAARSRWRSMWLEEMIATEGAAAAAVGATTLTVVVRAGHETRIGHAQSAGARIAHGGASDPSQSTTRL